MFPDYLKARLHRLAGLVATDQIVRNMTWLGAGELVARVSRLATTVLLAWMLGPVELGIAAIAITSFEIVRAFGASGIGQMVVRATEGELAATTAAANRASRAVSLALAVAQLLAGIVAAFWMARPELLPMVGCLAGVFLLMPLGLMPCYLVVRAGRMDVIARVSTMQVVADNILTAALALAGLGAWSVVLPKLLTTPIWVLGMRRAATWTPDPTVRPLPARTVWRFAAPILGSELLAAARLNLDKLIVASALGVEALGIYYFAVNAGLGLSLSLTTALTNSLYPVLAAVAHAPREMLARFDRAMWRNALPVGVVIALQAVAALVYVPFVFGPRWAEAAPLVAMLCASALTKPVADCAGQLLRAAGMPGRELAGFAVFSAAYLGVFAAAIGSGLGRAIAAGAMVSLIAQVALAIWARRLVRSAAPARSSDDGSLPGHTSLAAVR